MLGSGLLAASVPVISARGRQWPRAAVLQLAVGISLRRHGAGKQHLRVPLGSRPAPRSLRSTAAGHAHGQQGRGPCPSLGAVRVGWRPRAHRARVAVAYRSQHAPACACQAAVGSLFRLLRSKVRIKSKVRQAAASGLWFTEPQATRRSRRTS